MKILHIITGADNGGAERQLYNLLAGGLAQKYDCTVLSLRDVGNMGIAIRKLGVPIKTLNLHGGASIPKALLSLRLLMKELRPDIIQGWMYHGNLAASLAARMTSRRPVLSWNVRHSLDDLGSEKLLTQSFIRLGSKLSRVPDSIIYNSQISSKQHEQFGFSPHRRNVIPNGFDIKTLKSMPEIGAAVRREFGLTPSAVVVGHVARFHPMKNHSGFIHAAVDVAQKNPDAHFLLAGRNVTLENPALTGIIPSILLPRFVFAGERHDVLRLMQAMNVFCLSSKSGEAFPNVLGEAMASAVPCVATNVGDSAAIIGETGFVVPPSDIHALSHKLHTMLQKSTLAREELGQAARARVVAHYSLDAVVGHYVSLYEGLT